MKKFVIDIYRLRNKLHQYEFEVDDVFFNNLDQDIVKHGALKANIDLEKNDSFLGMDVWIEGNLELICDRCLEPFRHPISEHRKMIFKYGDREQELDHDVIMITDDTQQIDIGQHIFEFIGLAIPMKKLHPKYDEDSDDYESLVYSSIDDTESTSEIDPRWDKLNDLKEN